MIYLKIRKEKKKIRSKTQANEKLEQTLRVSISDAVKQRLIQISSSNNMLSQSRDWTLDENQTINIQQMPRRYQEKSRRNDNKIIDKSKCTPTKNVRIEEIKLSEIDRLRRLNKTQCSVKQQCESNLKIGCNSITLQFQKINKEKELRIHSNGQVNIDFDNSSSFNISQKIFRETAKKYQSKSNKNNVVQPYYFKKIKQINSKSKRSPIIPYKTASKTIYSTQKIDQYYYSSLHKIRENNPIKNDLSCKKQFLDLSTMLLEERRNIFYPTKANLSSKTTKAI